MKNNASISSKLAVLALGASLAAVAGVPLNNLQGTGGIAFNPLAYTAGQKWESGSTTNLNGIVSTPQFGTWFVTLPDADIDWWAVSTAITFFERLEVSYGYGFVNAHKYGDNSISTHNLGAKVRILDENAFDSAWVPAIALGTVYKYTDSATAGALGLDDYGFDFYAVASKLITQTPIPVLVSAGLLYSDEVVNGIVGHNDYGLGAFANIDIIPVENFAIGFEWKQGIDAGDKIHNNNYWNAHVAWFVKPNLTLVLAYADTGDKDKFYRYGKTKELGVGGGPVFSLQYQF
ncbi:MAG: DUF3034 family protein [Kiritimatiellae bacterium]|nr:DUF3034 family protein [Kiritimatiellia bacterium]